MTFASVTRFEYDIANSISSFLDRLIGGRESIDSSSITQEHKQIFDLLAKAKLEPTPEAYRLAWEYYNGASAKLRQSIDDILELQGYLSLGDLEQLTALHLNDLTKEGVLQLLSNGKSALLTGSRLVSQSRKDSRGFGKALEQEIERRSDDDQGTVSALLRLTEAMALKSLETERQLAKAEENIADMREKLSSTIRKAETDQLTGLPNRWAFEDHLKDAVLRSREAMEPLVAAFVDVDNFKSINDEHGHDTGDRVLKRIARLLAEVSNENCHVARHGGEEFVMLFKDKHVDEVFQILDAAREKLSNRDYRSKETGDQIGVVSFSAGIATLEGDGNPRSMLKNADLALYQAKNSGRNQVTIFRS